MTLLGDLSLWQLDTADVSVVSLDDTNATQITGANFSLSNAGNLLVDCSIFRVTFPTEGSIDDTITVNLREPAIDTSTVGSEDFVDSNTVDLMIAPDNGQELLQKVQILENTSRRIRLRVVRESGNNFVLTFRSGALYIEVVTERGTRDSTAGEHVVGFSSPRRWSLLGNGSVLRDSTIDNSTATSSSTPDNYLLSVSPNDHWLAGMATAYKWDEARHDSDEVSVKVTDAQIGEERRQWFFFCPTWQSEGITSGQFHHTTVTAGNKDTTFSDVLVGPAGSYRLYFAPTNANGVDDVQLDVDSTTVHTEGGSVAQDTFIVTRPVDLSSGEHDFRVLVTDSDKSDADYVFMWLPDVPSDNTGNDDVFAFPGYVSKILLAERLIKRDVVTVGPP